MSSLTSTLGLFLVLATLPVAAADSEQQNFERTRNAVFGSVSYGLDMHSASFTSLPGVEDCCVTYDDASGSSLNVRLGYLVPMSEQLELGVSLGIELGNASFEEREFLGWLNFDNEAVATYSDHTLETSKFGLEIAGTVSARPWEVPVVFSAGAGFDIANSMSAKTNEILSAPEQVVFENFDRTRNVQDTDVENVTGFMPFVTAGIGYDILNNESTPLRLGVFTQFKLRLGDVADATSWSTNTLSGGVHATWYFNSAEQPEPEPIPEPEPEPQPVVDTVPPILALSVEMYQNSNRVMPGTQYTLTKNETVVFEMAPSLPSVVFFARGETQNSTLDIATPTAVRGWQTSDEPAGTARRRAQEVAKTLRNANDIKITDTVVNMVGLTHPERADEFRRVDVLVGDNKLSLQQQVRDMSVVVASDSITLSAMPVFHVEASPFDFAGKSRLNGRQYSLLPDRPKQLVVSANQLRDEENLLTFEYTITDSTNRTVAASEAVLLRRNVTHDTIYTSQAYRGPIQDTVVVALFDFDSDTPLCVDAGFTKWLQTCADSGLSYELIGLTDSFGTIEHNRVLAQQRLQAITQSFDLGEDVATSIQTTPLFDDANPRTRMLNRSVIAVLKK